MNYSFKRTVYVGDINLSKWAEVKGGGEPTKVSSKGAVDQGIQPHKAKTALVDTQCGDDSVGGGRFWWHRVSWG
jgi:hypothetical protein